MNNPVDKDDFQRNKLFTQVRGSTRAEWWWPFRARTPEGHLFEGYLCKDRRGGILSGGLLISLVDGQDQPQLLPGMPEIPYPDQQALEVPSNVRRITLTRKLDGTALIFSPLHLPDGTIEVLARTRGVAVLINSRYRAWRELLARATGGGLRQRIDEVVRAQEATLVFELWGKENQHAVSYDEGLSLSLHTLVKGRAVQPWSQMLAVRRGLPLVPVLETLLPNGRGTEELAQATLDRGRALAAEMEGRNQADDRGLFREEGLVILVETPGRGRQWKVKAPSMAEYHRVSRRKLTPLTIRHEAWKLLEGGEPSLEGLLGALRLYHGEEELRDNMALIEREYWLWVQVVACESPDSSKLNQG